MNHENNYDARHKMFIFITINVANLLDAPLININNSYGIAYITQIGLNDLIIPMSGCLIFNTYVKSFNITIIKNSIFSCLLR